MLNVPVNSYDHAEKVSSPNHTVFLFGLMLNVPVNSYDHAEMVSSPNHTVFLDACYVPVKSYHQAFRFMVGPGHCPMISKYSPSLSKAVGQVDPSFLVVKKSHFIETYSSYSSTKQKVHVGSQCWDGQFY